MQSAIDREVAAGWRDVRVVEVVHLHLKQVHAVRRHLSRGLAAESRERADMVSYVRSVHAHRRPLRRTQKADEVPPPGFRRRQIPPIDAAPMRIRLRGDGVGMVTPLADAVGAVDGVPRVRHCHRLAVKRPPLAGEVRDNAPARSHADRECRNKQCRRFCHIAFFTGFPVSTTGGRAFPSS